MGDVRDMDIYKRKLEVRGYLFPNVHNTNVFYKMCKMAQKEYTIESSALEHIPMVITVSRYVPDAENQQRYNEEVVTEIFCKTFRDVEDAVKQIENLENGHPSAPYDKILVETNMKFIKKKNIWVKVS